MWSFVTTKGAYYAARFNTGEVPIGGLKKIKWEPTDKWSKTPW